MNRTEKRAGRLVAVRLEGRHLQALDSLRYLCSTSPTAPLDLTDSDIVRMALIYTESDMRADREKSEHDLHDASAEGAVG